MPPTSLALCGSRQDADDLVQETFVNVLKRPRLLGDHNEERSWALALT